MKRFDSACALLPESPNSDVAVPEPVIFWHRELPPLEAVALGEHFVEAISARVPGRLARRDELWAHCHRDLMKQATIRLRQEIVRLGGRYAHVMEESITSRHDETTGEAWLTGRFKYTLMR
jgi:hypothetical protein